MIPILNAAQLRAADAFTIQNEPITSLNLMERASKAFVNRFEELAPTEQSIFVFCGVGNNGGDGLAIARILTKRGLKVHVFVVGEAAKGTPDFKSNLDFYEILNSVTFIQTEQDVPVFEIDGLLIDALFGSGLSRPVSGVFERVIQLINEGGNPIYSVDIASGLYTDRYPDGPCVKPNFTISFQVPKWVFFQPDLFPFVGEWSVVPIGLDQNFINSQSTDCFLTESKDIRELIPIRSRFMHKGGAGRLTLIGGSRGKMGAVLLAGQAALRSGVGLLTLRIPQSGYTIAQSSVHEAMVSEDTSFNWLTDFGSVSDEVTYAIGPGLFTHPDTKKALSQFLSHFRQPIVLDADAINLLAEDASLLEKIPKNSILTPHPGEFRRLVGSWKTDNEKLDLLTGFCRRFQVNVVLKGAYSAVANTKGQVYFNPTGNPGMATGGSGDVLTGIVGSLLAQQLEPFHALLAGVYLHGLAGDLAAKQLGYHGLIASDIVKNLPQAFLEIR